MSRQWKLLVIGVDKVRQEATSEAIRKCMRYFERKPSRNLDETQLQGMKKHQIHMWLAVD